MNKPGLLKRKHSEAWQIDHNSVSQEHRVPFASVESLAFK